MYDTSSTYTGSYHDTWEEFVAAWRKIHRRQKAVIVREEAGTAGTLSVILSAQRAYVRTRSAADYRLRFERQIYAAIEAGRMTLRRAGTQQVAVDRTALAALGRVRRHTSALTEKANAATDAKAFWQKVDAGRLNKRVTREMTTAYTLWQASHPTGEAPTPEALQGWERLRSEVRQLTGAHDRPRVAVKRHLGFVPVGSMTQQRALEIAIAALESTSR